MGRGGRGGGSRAPARRPPPPRPAGQQQQSGGGSMVGGLVGTMMQGFAFGTGSSVAREAVHGIMGGGSSGNPQPMHEQPAQMQSRSACEFDEKAVLACLQANPGNADSCNVYLEALKSCQANA